MNRSAEIVTPRRPPPQGDGEDQARDNGVLLEKLILLGAYLERGEVPVDGYYRREREQGEA